MLPVGGLPFSPGAPKEPQVLPVGWLPFSPGAPTATLHVGRPAFTPNVAILRQLLSQSFMFGGLHLTLQTATLGQL